MTTMPSHRGGKRGMPLGDLAEIRGGYLFRRRIQSVPNGSHAVILMKDVDPQGGLDWKNLLRIFPERRSESYLIQPGDLLFLARGTRFPTLGPFSDLEAVMVSSHFFRVRPDPGLVLPAYLGWYLNQSPAQAYFHRHAQGLGRRLVSKQSLAAIEIPIPSRSTQEQIVALQTLRKEEVALMAQRTAKWDQLIQAICMRAATRGT